MFALILGVYQDGSYFDYITDENITGFINTFTGAFEAFYYLCHDKAIYRAPNADFLRFNFDPITGEEIDWNWVYETYKTSIYDYSENLEKKFNKIK